MSLTSGLFATTKGLFQPTHLIFIMEFRGHPLNCLSMKGILFFTIKSTVSILVFRVFQNRCLQTYSWWRHQIESCWGRFLQPKWSDSEWTKFCDKRKIYASQFQELVQIVGYHPFDILKNYCAWFCCNDLTVLCPIDDFPCIIFQKTACLFTDGPFPLFTIWIKYDIQQWYFRAWHL